MFEDSNYRDGGEHGVMDAATGKGKRYVTRNIKYAMRPGFYLPGGSERYSEYWRGYNERYEDFIRWKSPMNPVPPVNSTATFESYSEKTSTHSTDSGGIKMRGNIDFAAFSANVGGSQPSSSNAPAGGNYGLSTSATGSMVDNFKRDTNHQYTVDNQANAQGLFAGYTGLTKIIDYTNSTNSNILFNLSKLDGYIHGMFSQMGRMTDQDCQGVLNAWGEITHNYNAGVYIRLVGITTLMEQTIRDLPDSPSFTATTLNKLDGSAVQQSANAYRGDFINASVRDFEEWENYIMLHIRKVNDELIEYRQLTNYISDVGGALSDPFSQHKSHLSDNINNVIDFLNRIVRHIQALSSHINNIVKRQQQQGSKS